MEGITNFTNEELRDPSFLQKFSLICFDCRSLFQVETDFKEWHDMFGSDHPLQPFTEEIKRSFLYIHYKKGLNDARENERSKRLLNSKDDQDLKKIQLELKVLNSLGEKQPIVSFIGDSGVGKSTIIRAFIPNLCDWPASSNEVDPMHARSTSRGIVSYSNATVNDVNISVFDSQGYDGNTESMTEELHKEMEKLCGSSPELLRKTSESFYTQLMHTVSHVIVYILKGKNVLGSVQKLLRYIEVTQQRAKKTVKPHVIFVLNYYDNIVPFNGNEESKKPYYNILNQICSSIDFVTIPTYESRTFIDSINRLKDRVQTSISSDEHQNNLKVGNNNYNNNNDDSNNNNNNNNSNETITRCDPKKVIDLGVSGFNDILISPDISIDFFANIHDIDNQCPSCKTCKNDCKQCEQYWNDFLINYYQNDIQNRKISLADKNILHLLLSLSKLEEVLELPIYKIFGEISGKEKISSVIAHSLKEGKTSLELYNSLCKIKNTLGDQVDIREGSHFIFDGVYNFDNLVDDLKNIICHHNSHLQLSSPPQTPSHQNVLKQSDGYLFGPSSHFHPIVTNKTYS